MQSLVLPILNLFLASLPQQDFDALRPHLERVKLPARRVQAAERSAKDGDLRLEDSYDDDLTKEDY